MCHYVFGTEEVLMQMQTGVATLTKNTEVRSDRYKVIFDGRCSGAIAVMVDVPPKEFIRIQVESLALGHPYMSFGRAIGRVGGVNVYFNTYIHAPQGEMERMQSFIGKKLIGHPVVVEKTLPDGRVFCHLDVYMASRPLTVNYQVLVRCNPPTERWWSAKCGRQPSARDVVHPLPGTEGGVLALMRLGR